MNHPNLPKLGFVLVFLSAAGCLAAAGCHHNAQAAGSNPTVSSPAPFASPPVLAGTPDVATLVAKVNPAVVNITTQHDVRGRGEMEGMFGGGRGNGDRVQRQHALGSGFIIDGRVVTNAHVVEGADRVRVKLADDREFDATVKGRDARLDIAVLELKGATNLPNASLGSSDELRVGEYVLAIGNPFGLGHTVTMGIVSAKSRAIGAGPYDDFIQTDASINPGNSGGPLFNLRGQVVGINTAINPNGKGIGFAIPSDAIKDVLPQLASSGHVSRGRLGVAIQDVDPPMAKALGLDRPKGALVGEVEPGGPADKAGLHAGDVIVSVDQTDILHGHDLPRVVARHAPGSHVSVKVMREKGTRAFDVALDALKERGDEIPVSGEAIDPAAPSTGLGIGVSNAPGGGVLVQRVFPGSASDGELAPGDVVIEVNRAPVSSAEDLATRVLATPKGDAVLLKVRRQGQARFVAIERK